MSNQAPQVCGSFDAGYHDAAIRTSRHEHCFKQNWAGFDIQERGK
jgi:hypothetical protein